MIPPPIIIIRLTVTQLIEKLPVLMAPTPSYSVQWTLSWVGPDSRTLMSRCVTH